MARFEVVDDLPKGRYELVGDAGAGATKKSGFGARLNDEIANIPRQFGLTARYGMEGIGGIVDDLAAPFRAGVNALLPDEYAAQPGLATKAADFIGLPTPETSQERIVGDASRLIAGSMVPLSLASKVEKVATGTTKAVSSALAANPLQQVVSAGAAGGAGGYVRETGGNEGSQLAASLAAGLAAPYSVNAGLKAGGLISKRLAPPVASVDSAIERSGIVLGDLPANVRSSIRADVQAALKQGDNLSPDAVRRLADYRLTNTTPTASRLTLDPAMVSQERNLAKQGINSADKGAQQLGQLENANNRRLIDGLNDLGAGGADDAYAGGQKIMGALSRRNDAAKSAIGARYDAARASDGRSAALDPYAFTQSANNMLDDALLGGKLPGDVRNLLNKAAKGEMPLTVDVAEGFKTRIGDLQRASNDMAERKALGLVRQALDDTPLLDGQGAEAITAFNKARRINRVWEGIVKKTPALKAVRDGVEPDKFVQDFVIGNGSKANVADLAALKRSVQNNPEAMTAVKSQITAYLKKQALNGAADEVGNLSQSNYNKALSNIGERRLALFFSKQDVDQMKAIGRVASYEQFQPKGSAVNNSNTAGAALSSVLDRIGSSSLLSKIPFGSVISDPVQSISVGVKARQALNVPDALLGIGSTMAPRQPAGLLMSPAAFMRPEDERKGLLAP